jgi:hypothetical protein
MPGTQPVSSNISLASFRRAIHSLVIALLMLMPLPRQENWGLVVLDALYVYCQVGAYTGQILKGAKPVQRRAPSMRVGHAART